jgi:hypothetical protein
LDRKTTRTVKDPFAKVDGGGKDHRLDRWWQRPENEGQRLSATVCLVEFLLRNDGVNILRHRGVPIGKRDFLGPVNWL